MKATTAIKEPLLAENDKEKWLEERRKGVTATDISAISGLNPYHTIYDVFLEKLDLIEPMQETAPMRWGRKMEPVLADVYAQMTGATLINPGLLVNPEKSLMRGTPDRIVVDPETGEWLKVVEIKTAGIRQASRWGEPGTDDIPDEYLCQVQWQMGITGLTEADVIVSIGGQEPVIYTVERNNLMINGLYDRAFKFWNDHVVPKVPPVVDSSESAAEMLARLYNRADLDLLPSSEEVERLVKMAENQKAFLKVAEDNVRYAENQLKAIIGDHEGVEGEWGRLTWRKTKDRHDIDYKSIVAETAIPTELILKHTRTKPGYRRFLYQPAKKEA